jgi:hypothetical protein
MKNRFQTLLFKCNLHRYSLGRGVDLVLAPPAGGSDRPAVANVRIWQLNVGETDGRRAGVRTLQVVAPAGVVSDADGVVWSGELSQGTGFEDHAPHVVVNLVPGCEGTVLPLDGADAAATEAREVGGGHTAGGKPSVEMPVVASTATTAAEGAAAGVKDSSSTAAVTVAESADNARRDGAGRDDAEEETAQARVELKAKELELEPTVGWAKQQRVASGRRAVTDPMRSGGSLLAGLAITPLDVRNTAANDGDGGGEGGGGEGGGGGGARRPPGLVTAPNSNPGGGGPPADLDLDSMLFSGTPRVIGRRVRGGALGRPRPAHAPVQASWDSLANFTKTQAGRVGGSSPFVYGDADADAEVESGGGEGGGGGGGGGGGAGRRAGVKASEAASGSGLGGAGVSPSIPSAAAAAAAAAESRGGGAAAVKNPPRSDMDGVGISGGGDGGGGGATAPMEDSLTAMMHQPSSGSTSGAAAIAAAALLAADDASAAAASAAAASSGYPDPSWESFAIPERPRGQTLRIVIHSTWGDPHYVGLAGLDIFDAEGVLLTPSDPETQVVAEPSSVNVLEGYSVGLHVHVESS